MTGEHEKRLRELGAVKYRYMCIKSRDWRGPTETSITEIQHFINAGGEEVALLYYEGEQHEGIKEFHPPREWHPSFLEHYKEFDF